uniref:Uncharacterized protein n=1 Tax=Siphoviridae sp. ctS1E53 TaxID=2826340 RepID=A0A8S5MF04_9CAUD|nr:MAG TPA: hypothetical protein [Siphoviridae sp. ctS1E53]
MANETFYALVENGVVTNVMVLYPPSAAEFEGAVPCGEIPVAIGDTYDGEHFYRAGERVLTALEQAQRDAEDMQAALELLGVETEQEAE